MEDERYNNNNNNNLIIILYIIINIKNKVWAEVGLWVLLEEVWGIGTNKNHSICCLCKI